MTSGIQRALAPRVPEGAMRLVVFLTDGYIGNDSEIVRLLQQLRGDARFFSFGVGHSVNRYLMREIARVGRGAARIVLPTEDADAAADEFAARLASPVLTDVEIDWGEASITDVFPREIPDLFHGQSVRVMGRYSLPAGGERRSVTVRGRLAGKAVVLPIELDLPYRSMGLAGTALPMLWARARIEDHMTSYLAPGLDARGRDELEEQVTRLGLAHRLVTQWTSFVAVARPIVNPGGFGRHADVAVPRVEGLSELAYPTGSSPPGGTPKGASQGFRGNSAPEPETWAALLGIAAAAGLIRRRRRRNTATT